MITKKLFDQLPNDYPFATSVTDDPRLYREPVRWVAVKGMGNDWAIYYHLLNKDAIDIMREGDKCFTKEVVKELVPCEEEIFNLYRFF